MPLNATENKTDLVKNLPPRPARGGDSSLEHCRGGDSSLDYSPRYTSEESPPQGVEILHLKVVGVEILHLRCIELYFVINMFFFKFIFVSLYFFFRLGLGPNPFIFCFRSIYGRLYINVNPVGARSATLPLARTYRAGNNLSKCG